MTIRSLLSAALLPLLTAAPMHADDSVRILSDFSKTPTPRRWRAVNDGVMGGVSQGRFAVDDETRVLTFSGTLSLENNGGFASIRTDPMREDLSEFDELVVRVRGDGRKYWFTVGTDFRIFAGSYRMELATEAGKWIEVRFPLERFRATSFGRPMRNAPPLNKRAVESLGFLLSDKNPGEFKLEIDWIKAAKKPAATEVEVARNEEGELPR
jgi:monofunctional biosynthetic peptidoglycan transglycosylase